MKLKMERDHREDRQIRVRIDQMSGEIIEGLKNIRFLTINNSNEKETVAKQLTD